MKMSFVPVKDVIQGGDGVQCNFSIGFSLDDISATTPTRYGGAKTERFERLLLVR